MALLRRRCRNRGETRGSSKGPPFQHGVKQAARGAYSLQGVDGNQSLMATEAAVASFHKDDSWKEYTMKKLSARNQLKGKIVEVKKGATTSHVRIDIGNGIVITSSITNEAVADLNLKTGDEAWAVIKASDVMIGV
jgi:molybdopterin-binding protein